MSTEYSRTPGSDHPKMSRQGGHLWELMIAYESLGQICSLLEYEGANEVKPITKRQRARIKLLITDKTREKNFRLATKIYLSY